MLANKFFRIPYPRPPDLAYPDRVLFNEGPLSRGDPLSGQSESWPDRGAPERSIGWWPRWSAGRRRALRHWARAAGVISCARWVRYSRLRGCLASILAPPAAPSPRAVREGLANLGRTAPRECETMSVIPGRLRSCASEPGIQTFSSAVQHLWIPGSRRGAPRNDGYWVAALISLIASSLSHSAGPAMLPISQPWPSISTEVGIPSARPMVLRS
jgi:hypothetical protein